MLQNQTRIRWCFQIKNEGSEKEENISFEKPSKMIFKMCTKFTQELICSGNYKSLLKENDEDISGKISYIHALEELAV
jgi:hypothetical protein